MNEQKGIETIIGPSVTVKGNFVGRGNVVVEGIVEGSLKTDQDLRVGSKAKIKAEITALNAVIAGEIHGNVKIKEKLELTETAKIFGDVETKTLIMAPGAILNGKCTMSKPQDVKPET